MKVNNFNVDNIKVNIFNVDSVTFNILASTVLHSAFFGVDILGNLENTYLKGNMHLTFGSVVKHSVYWQRALKVPLGRQSEIKIVESLKNAVQFPDNDVRPLENRVELTLRLDTKEFLKNRICLQVCFVNFTSDHQTLLQSI